ncbi:hypothetical protein AALA80_19620 [Oscillospiraceae bacterium 50-60]
MDSKAISRRLAALQQIADRGKPCKVVVTFTDGSRTTTDPGGALDILRERDPLGEIESFQADQPVWRDWARLLTVALHPAQNRRIEDFE